jgi:hypothetical protein
LYKYYIEQYNQQSIDVQQDNENITIEEKFSNTQNKSLLELKKKRYMIMVLFIV